MSFPGTVESHMNQTRSHIRTSYSKILVVCFVLVILRTLHPAYIPQLFYDRGEHLMPEDLKPEAPTLEGFSSGFGR